MLPQCKSNFKCDKYVMSHNKLLHFKQDSVNEKECSRIRENESGVRRVSDECVNASGEQAVVSLKGSVCASSGTVLLSTAVVRVRRRDGSCEIARVLMDPGSQSSFVTSSFIRRLSLPIRQVCVPVCGLSVSNVCKANDVVSCEILPENSDNNSQIVSCLVLNKITNFIPNVYVPIEQWDYLKPLKLAGSKFHIPSKVDILLGAEVFPSIIRDGRVVGACGGPYAINSVFGWLVMGEVRNKNLKNLQKVSMSNFISDENLDSIFKRFWEIESEPVVGSFLRLEERRCEDHFVSTHSREKNGRYRIRLPFKTVRPDLGNSRDIALRRLLASEGRLNKNELLKRAYSDFMKDYLDSGHMELVKNNLDVRYWLTTFHIIVL
nr:uncharacterized protein LOC113403758 [Vanessa tameamea]